jgi:hypothetical protein
MSAIIEPRFSLREIAKLTKLYESIHAELLSQVLSLEEVQQTFPIKASEDAPYDDLVLASASCKHKAISLLRDSITAAKSAEIDLSFCESFILLDKAQELLVDKGFEKFTDSLRQAAVAYSEELKELSKAVAKVKSVEETCQRLCRAFESDEVNFRKMYDKQDVKGF